MAPDVAASPVAECPKVVVTIRQGAESYPCSTAESLLQGMLRIGRRGIPIGCVNGGCGVCKVRILEGRVRSLGPVSRAHLSVDEEACGVVLACRVAPDTDVCLTVQGKLAKALGASS